MSKKAIFITGASSGIGQAMALLLAEQGYRVFGTSRNPDNVSSIFIGQRSEILSNGQVYAGQDGRERPS